MDYSSPQIDDDILNDADVFDEEDEFVTPDSRYKRKGKERDDSPVKAKKKNTVARSWVWEHYTRMKENRNKCKCHYCARTMGCATANGTTCLKNHLAVCKEFKAWKDSRDHTQHVLNPESGGVGAEESNVNLKLAKVSEAVFREATNEMIILGELPLSFVDSLAWRHFCSRVNLHKPKSRKTTARDVVEMYVKKKAAMMKILGENKQRVSLTTDIWVAPITGASYMVITTHFIDRTWRLKKMIIGFKHVSDHKGSTICSVLLQCLEEWGIRRVFTVTVDNATANTSALKKFKDAMLMGIGDDALVLGGEYLHLRCSAHIINLVVNDGFQDVNNGVAAIRNAVQYVRSSTKRLESFEQKVEFGRMTRGSLSLDCKTRWNSTYLMLIRALKFRLAFDKMEEEDKLYNDYFSETVEGKKRIGPPKEDDWNDIERLVRFLVIFYNSTLVVSASSTVSSYRCYNEIVTIKRNLIALSTNSDTKLRKKAIDMIVKFDKYWGGSKEINPMLIIGSVFDPRNKMKFASLCFDMLYGKDSEESKQMNEGVNELLGRLFGEYNRDINKPGNDTISTSAGTSSQSGQESQGHVATDVFHKMDLTSDLGYERMDLMYTDLINESGYADSCSELELYLKEKVEVHKPSPLGLQFNVLGWWKISSIKYPILAEMAKDILAMQVSSVASESAFSTSMRILEPSRSCLTHYMMEALMCNEQWLKAELNLNEKGVVTTDEILAEVELQDKLQREFEAKCNFQD